MWGKRVLKVQLIDALGIYEVARAVAYARGEPATLRSIVAGVACLTNRLGWRACRIDALCPSGQWAIELGIAMPMAGDASGPKWSHPSWHSIETRQKPSSGLNSALVITGTLRVRHHLPVQGG